MFAPNRIASSRPLIQTLERRRLFAAGDLDITFGGGDGIAVVQAPTGNYLGPQTDFTADGKLYVAGGYLNQTPTGATNYVVLSRANADGTLDTTFAGGSISFGVGFSISDVLAEPNGNVTVVGSVQGGGFIERYNAAGQTVPFTAIANSPAAQSGFGRFLTAIDRAADGDYYLAGAFQNPADGLYENAVARINADGSFDTAFDGDGLKFLAVNGSSAIVNRIVVMPDGTIGISGSYGLQSGFVQRLSPAGAVMSTDATSPNNDTAFTGIAGLAATADNKLVFQVDSLLGSGDNTSAVDVLRTVAGPFGTAATFGGNGNGVIANGNGVISITRADTATFTLTQTASATAAPTFQKTYALGGTYNYVLGSKIIGDKLLLAVYQNSPQVQVAIVRIDLAAPVVTGTAKIAGVVFNDANGNRQRDAGETGIANRSVYIDANNNSIFDAGEKSAATDAGGYYELSGVATGTYTVRQLLPTGWTQTTPAAGQAVTIATDGQYKFIADFGSKVTTTPPPVVTPPAAPKSAKAALITTPKRLVRLTWTDAATNESGYRIERRYRGETAWNTIATLGVNASKYDDTTAYKGVAYEYRVVAINAAGTAASGVLSVTA